MSRPKDLNAPSRWNMRIWDDDKKEWLCQSDKDALTYYGFDITGGETTEFQGLPKWHPNRHLIWEQSTGLKDKKGKEIYEGDIVRRVEDGGFDIVGVVEWSEKAARFWIKHYYYPNGKKWEVIGNIHENKELSGGEE